MGLGFNDGFPPSDVTGFWEHWCPAYDGFLSTEHGCECNWCGKKENQENDDDV